MMLLPLLVFFSSYVHPTLESQPLSCGEVCYFDEYFQIADCSGIGLQVVPTRDGCTSARLLDLSYNDLSSLHGNDMIGNRGAHHLDFSFNRISYIEPRSFSGSNEVPSLNLYMSSNEIPIIQNDTFSQCKKSLQQLHLDRNNIAVIERGALVGMIKLAQLFLGHNQLQNLEATLFRDLISLESLYLNSNRLTSLPGDIFATLNRLYHVDLSNNNLIILGDEIFNQQCHLKTVVFSNNRLRNIPSPSRSQSLNRLQVLDLRNNNITDASNITQYIERTEALLVNDNPFYCDCNLEGVRMWIQREITSTPLFELSCVMLTSNERSLIRSLPSLCPMSTLPTGKDTTSSSWQSAPRREDTGSDKTPVYERLALAGVWQENDISAMNHDEEKAPTTVEHPPVGLKEGPLSHDMSTFTLIILITVAVILGFMLTASIIILLVICLCQTDRNVQKMTTAILESRLTPRRVKNVVDSVKNFTSPFPPENNKKRQNSFKVTSDETPLKPPRVSSESTPTLKVDMSEVRKRTPQSTDKMILNNSPTKMPKPRNDENARKTDDICVDLNKIEERKPLNRKLQFEQDQGCRDTDDLDDVGSLTSSSEVLEEEGVNISKNHGSDKEDNLNQSFREKDLENGESKEKKCGVSEEIDCCKEMVNTLNKENANQTKNLNFSSHSQLKDRKLKLRKTPQKSAEKKFGVLTESNRENLNLCSHC